VLKAYSKLAAKISSVQAALWA